MTCLPRPRPLTLLLWLAGSLSASFVGQSQAAGLEPLQVDPVLLGMPPIQPIQPIQPPPASDRWVGEARAVETPAAEATPQRGAPSTATPIATPVAPTIAAPIATPVAPTIAAPIAAPTATPTEPPIAAPTLSPSSGDLDPLERSDAAAAVPAELAAPDSSVSWPEAPPDALPAAAPTPALPQIPAANADERPAAEAQPVVAPAVEVVDLPQLVPVGPPLDEPQADVPASTVAVDSAVPARDVLPDPTPVTPTLSPPTEAPSAQFGAPLSPPAAAAPGVAENRPASPGAPSLAAPDAAPVTLRAAKAMVPPPLKSKEPRPVFLSGQRISGVVGRELLAEDDAQLRKVGTALTADRLTYWPVDDEVEAVGNARLEQGDDVIAGPKMRMKLEDQVGYVEQASYSLKRQPPPGAIPLLPPVGEETTGFAAPRVLNIQPGQTQLQALSSSPQAPTEGRGNADRIDLEGENQIQMHSATYTTCKPGNDDWYLKLGELHLDFDNSVGSGSDATIRFFDVPILYSPWVSFPLNNERKSGLLAPTYGSSSDNGFMISVPYYWNIAPNMDATITPRILSKRGFEVGTNFRYLNTAYGANYFGDYIVDFLPHDRIRDIDRWGVALTHTQTPVNGFSGSLTYNRVSDNYYFTDLSSQITSTAKTQLLQQATATYDGGGWWNATANLQAFQTLEPDPLNPVTAPYRLLPQITVNARQPEIFSTDSAFFGQYTYFVSPNATQVEGQRTVLQPQVSLPYVTPGWYVTPRVGVNATYYALTYPVAGAGQPDSISRVLPIFSIDSGMTFERPSQWFGRDYTQTLEPRLYYLAIPYKNQNDIPVFDTALADFNFAQIFADNQFSGWDRINNANQLTAAVESRLIDPATGNEIMRGAIAQRFYFSPDQVELPGTTFRQWDKSDFLAGFTGQVYPRVYADAAVQYDPGDRQFQRYGVGARYLPAPGKVLNATYSYNSDASIPINQVDISGQWPITARWQAVGRYNYSLLQDQPIEIIGGIEYNAGCWIVRAVGHRVQTTQLEFTTQVFVQLELSDFSSIGTNPLNLLQRRIPGYGLANQPQADRYLAEQQVPK